LDIHEPMPRRRAALIHLVVAALLLGIGLSPPSSRAADAPKAATSLRPGMPLSGTNLAPPEPGTVVEVNKRPIAAFRATILGNPPSQRAQAASLKIRKALEARGPGEVTVSRLGEHYVFLIDGTGVFVLTPEDIGDPLPAVQQVAVEEVQRRLQAAVEELEEMRDPKLLAKGAGYSAAALAITYLLLRLIFLARRKVATMLEARLSRLVAKLQGASLGTLRAEQTLSIVLGLNTAIAWAVALVVLNAAVSFALEQFAYTRPWGEALTGWLLGVLAAFATAILGAIPDVAIAVMVFVLARFVVRINTMFMRRIERGRLHWGWLDADTAGPTRRIGNFIVWLFAVAMAYPYLPGANTEAFKGMSVLAGLMISLGAANVVGRALSGLSLMYTRSLREGEYVKVGEVEGTVVSIGLFATRLHTGQGEEVTLPNTEIVSKAVHNFSRLANEGSFILPATVTIGYATPWRQVHAMLLEAARRTTGVAQEPAPYVVQTALSDYYVEYRLCAQADRSAPRRRAEAMSALHANIQDVFNEYGVQIMSPHYIADPPQPQVVPPAHWYPPPAAAPAPGSTGGTALGTDTLR